MSGAEVYNIESKSLPHNRHAVPGLAEVLNHDAIRHDARHGDMRLSDEDNFPSKMLASQLESA
jgi:hypothetical protein